MAKSIEDAEFWLPSEFLSEEDFFMDRESLRKNNSAFSSPVESVAGSAETESSDEEDFLAGLTRRLVQSSLNDVHRHLVPSFTHDQHENKYWNMAGSPQSTLSGLGSLSGSRNGSPNGPSQVPSPPTTPFGVKNDTWDLIYAAAGQVARLKMSQQGRALLDAHQRSAALARNQNQNSAFYSNNSVQFQQVRQSQISKQESSPSPAWGTQGGVGWQAQPQSQPRPRPQGHHQQIQNRGRAVGYESPRCGHPVSLSHSAAWPTLQSQNKQPQPVSANASGMRAVFLGGSDVKKKSTGTGVFLPRRYGNPVETNKKSGGSTVLIPPKVVQALNLNIDEINGQAQPKFNPVGGYSQIHVDGMMMGKSNGLLTQQRRSLRHEGPLNHELRLPQEWTY